MNELYDLLPLNARIEGAWAVVSQLKAQVEAKAKASIDPWEKAHAMIATHELAEAMRRLDQARLSVIQAFAETFDDGVDALLGGCDEE
jgi:hypothetical protein